MGRLEAASGQFGASDFLESFPESDLFRDWNQANSWKIFGKGPAAPGHVSWCGVPHRPLFPRAEAALGHSDTPKGTGPDLATLVPPPAHWWPPPCPPHTFKSAYACGLGGRGPQAGRSETPEASWEGGGWGKEQMAAVLWCLSSARQIIVSLDQECRCMQIHIREENPLPLLGRPGSWLFPSPAAWVPVTGTGVGKQEAGLAEGG